MEFAGKRVVVMGLGRFGGGIGVTRWLAHQGASVLVTDQADEKDLHESISRLADIDVQYRLGGHDPADLNGCELLVISPAVDRSKSEFVREALRREIPCSSEMNLFLERCRGRIVGVTGSVGKSTTTAMIAAMLEAAARVSGWSHGRSWLGGNIGKSLLDDLPSIQPADIVVLEMSSFQLEDAGPLRISPHIALVTNLRENHLDRHGTMVAYASAKSNIHRFQTTEDHLVLPFTGAESLPDLSTARGRVHHFGVNESTGAAVIESPLQPVGDRDVSTAATPFAREEIPLNLSVPGLHNVQNAAGAMVVGRLLGVADGGAIAALSEFAGLAHRLEFVRDHGGVRYYNDSKATSPEAAATSIRAFKAPVVVLVGGSDKGGSFEGFGEFLFRHAKAVVCMGQTRERISAAIRLASKECGAGPTIIPADAFPKAVTIARELSRPGDVVLLSPGCASYDWFRNYEQRGDAFRDIVSAWR